MDDNVTSFGLVDYNYNYSVTDFSELCDASLAHEVIQHVERYFWKMSISL